jgi:hypothetical protein
MLFGCCSDRSTRLRTAKYFNHSKKLTSSTLQTVKLVNICMEIARFCSIFPLAFLLFASIPPLAALAKIDADDRSATPVTRSNSSSSSLAIRQNSSRLVGSWTWTTHSGWGQDGSGRSASSRFIFKSDGSFATPKVSLEALKIRNYSRQGKYQVKENRLKLVYDNGTVRNFTYEIKEDSPGCERNVCLPSQLILIDTDGVREAPYKDK